MRGLPLVSRPPDHARSGQGTEFTALQVRASLGELDIEMAFIEKGIPWENGDNDSFNGTLRDELLNGETFTL